MGEGCCLLPVPILTSQSQSTSLLSYFYFPSASYLTPGAFPLRWAVCSFRRAGESRHGPCSPSHCYQRGQNHSLFQEEARVDAREGSAGDTSGGLHLQGAPGLSQKQGQSHPYQCLSPASKPCLFLSGSGHALMSVSAAPSPAPRYHFGDLPSQGQTTGCFSLTSTRPPAHLTPLPRPPEGRLMGTEAANPVQVAWLCVLGQQEFGAPSDLSLPLLCP